MYYYNIYLKKYYNLYYVYIELFNIKLLKIIFINITKKNINIY